jgi:hypothetical protein
MRKMALTHALDITTNGGRGEEKLVSCVLIEV